MRLKSRLESDVFSSILVDPEEEEENKHWTVRMIESTTFQLLLLIMTFYSLFFDDYQQLLCGKQLDYFFDGFSLTFMAIFAFEVLISSLFIRGYFNSYFFYLDLVSTLSIIIDLNLFKNILNNSSSSTGSDSIAKVGKLVRLVRLIRLFRISKIYKSFSKSRNNSKSLKAKTQLKSKHAKAFHDLQESEASKEFAADFARHKRLGAQTSSLHMQSKANLRSRGSRDSKVGKKISEVATKTVILMVFLLLILLPIFNSDFWTDSGSAGNAFCQQLSYVLADSANFSAKADLSRSVYQDNEAIFDLTDQARMLGFTTKTVKKGLAADTSQGNLLRVHFSWQSGDYYLDSTYALRRYEEMIISSCGVSVKVSPQANATKSSEQISVYVDDINNSVLSAGLNILRTAYICFVLIGGSYLFSWNAYKLVISPIERMIEKAANVIRTPQEIKEEAFILQEAKEHKVYMNSIEGNDEAEEAEGNLEEKQLETLFLEEAISKISVLLAVGLGDAGSELIYNYLKNEKDILNIASEMEAIFGFCDIRNFTDATEVLQEEVMIFVNTIAEIVHTLADLSLGAANKNVGDAFLVVWRIRPEDALPINKNGIDNSIVWNNIADLALFSVLSMHAEIGRNFELRKFVDKEEMQVRIGKNFRVRLGFGLHFGWAIEGALGSLFKIDATYLSPNVNMAARLEGDTKMYGVPVLMSGDFFDLLSLPVKSYCRQVDAIIGNEQSPPLRLYSPLISDKFIKYTMSQPIDKHLLKTKERSNFKKVIRADLHHGRLVGKRIFQNNSDIAILISAIDSHLVKFYRSAFDNFKYGFWSKAKADFEKVLEIDAQDGPTLFLMDYMKTFEFKKPDWWNGARKDDGSSGH